MLELPYDLQTTGLILAIFFLAAFAKGITGLGFSTACLPFLVLAIGLRSTLPLLLIPSLASNLLVMRDAGGFKPTVKRFWPLFLACLPGIVAGLALLTWLDPRFSAAFLGLVLIGYCLFALAQPDLRLPERWERPLLIPVGLINGTVNGLTGSQVMPMLPYLLSLRLTPNEMVQATNCAFTVSSLMMVAGFAQLGLMTPGVALISVAGLLPVWLGIQLGGRVRRRLDPATFRRIVLYVLIGLGGVLIGRLFFVL
jgi:uncharacterized membrane protein YfcA